MQPRKRNRLTSYFNGLPSWQKLLAILMIALIVAGAVKAYYYTTVFGGADLRERIVGARALNTAQSPYYYKWMPGESERLINPNLNRGRNISGLSVAPGTLYIHYLFSPLPYKWLRYAWFVFQYCLLAYVFTFFLKRSVSATAGLYVLTIGTLFFACSAFWLLHIDRGQVYILYAFFFCLLYQLYESGNRGLQFFAGLLLAFSIYCRPTFVVAGLPLLFRLKRPAVTGFVVGVAAFAVGLAWNLSLWKDYLTAMGAFTQVTSGLEMKAAAPIDYPAVVEGMANLTKGKLDFMCGGIWPLDVWMARLNINLPGWLYVLIYSLLVAGLTIGFRKRLVLASVASLCLFGFVCYMLSEYIMPAPRGAYTLVQWSFAVLLMFSTGRMQNMDTLLVVTGLCMITAFPFYFPYFYNIGEVLLVCSSLHFIYRNASMDRAILNA